jgi:hypothetical protein
MGGTCLTLELPQLLSLLLLGGVVALDATSVGQVMISRPLVSGTLAGFLLGDPQTGLLLGCILEGANLGAIPVGASRFMEPGPAAIPSVVAALILGGGGGIALGAGLGMFMSLIGGESVVLQRRWNGRILAGGFEGGRRSLVRRFWGCVAIDGLRGVVLTGVGITLALSLPDVGAGRWHLDSQTTAALLLLPGALAVGALLDRWRLTPRRWAIFAAALASGLVVGGIT